MLFVVLCLWLSTTDNGRRPDTGTRIAGSAYRTHDQKCFTISVETADWRELMIVDLQRIMQPSTADAPCSEL